jgi:hypothetical protein
MFDKLLLDEIVGTFPKNVTLVNRSPDIKFSPIDVIHAGTSKLTNPVRKNKLFGIVVMVEGIVTSDKDTQSWNTDGPIDVTDDGITILVRLEQDIKAI